MTLATIKKMTSRLTKAQKVKLAGDLLEETHSINRSNPSYEEIERRADEVLSGKVKAISGVESKARIDRLISKIKREAPCKGWQSLRKAAFSVILSLWFATIGMSEYISACQ